MKFLQNTTLSFILIALMSFVFWETGHAQKKALKLKAYAKIDKDYSKETSGIVQSRTYPGVFWVLDDSGNKDEIYAIDIEGEAASGKKKYEGQKVKGANNRDWEDILVDDSGHVIIADIGNNCECRDNLRFYVLEETEPDDEKNEVLKEVRIKYPQKGGFLRIFSTNYDAEAAFFVRGSIYILTKHSKMFGKTMLFRLDNWNENEVNELIFVGEYKIDGSVTGADVNPEGTKLAILTYNSVWVYDLEEGKGLLEGKAYTRRIRATQVESIAFHKDELIIVDEREGRMYKVKLSDLEPVD